MSRAQSGFHYFLVYKPFQVLCQFSPVAGKKNLKDYFEVPERVYPVGRLDYDSEGLLILTDDPALNHRLLNPGFAHEREYRVQVEGIPTPTILDQLRAGPVITVDGKKYQTLPCKAAMLPEPVQVPLRDPPIRFRKNIPSSWISMVTREGKNRQVRKMTAAVGIPTLRLIRTRIEGLHSEGMSPGDMIVMSREEIYSRLFGKEKQNVKKAADTGARGSLPSRKTRPSRRGPNKARN
jgi:23S rRNA pseudouridine2457 synthase